MVRKLLSRASAMLATIAAIGALFAGAVIGVNHPEFIRAARAQGFTVPDLSNIIGHWSFLQGGTGVAPVGTTCTIAAGSTDAIGSCATTGATATVTFNRTWGVAPNCLVVDASATSTVSMPVYTVSATAITFSTVITAHTLFWVCGGKTGSV